MCVIIWDNVDGNTYKIYRAKSENGDYECIGTSSAGSYIDTNASYPSDFFYKVETIQNGSDVGILSEPMKEGTNLQKVYNVSVIIYHNFVSEEDIENGVEFGEYAISPEDFEEDLKYLKNNGYTTITSNDLIDFINGNKPLPVKAVIISIDDGSYGVYKNAWPLLKKYKMKADFNIIVENIDLTWENVNSGGSRVGEAEPYCVWEELIEMSNSGVINLCSHTYGLHKYRERRGLEKLENETEEEYAAVIKRDMNKVLSAFEGWTGITPKTLAYPYSKRSAVTDKLLLANTTYEILMAGEYSRKTMGNYFVSGASPDGYYRLISRPCRMYGTSIKEYLDRIPQNDALDGIVQIENEKSLSFEEWKNIAVYYSPFNDVIGTEWFASTIYYAYANGILSGTSCDTFSPDTNISRAMVATILYRMSDKNIYESKNYFKDVIEGNWYKDAAIWAHNTGILEGIDDLYYPNEAISRQQLALSMYKYAKYSGCFCDKTANLNEFKDSNQIDVDKVEAMKWAVGNGIFNGKGNGILDPTGNITRAEMATVLYNWNTQNN